MVDENGDEDSDEPPKPDVKEVKEDDAFYSKKYVSLFHSPFKHTDVTLKSAQRFVFRQLESLTWSHVKTLQVHCLSVSLNKVIYFTQIFDFNIF